MQKFRGDTLKYNKTLILSIPLFIMSNAYSYPLSDTDFLKGAYCFHMGQAPLLSADLSTKEKESGQNKFFKVLYANNLDFPAGKDYDDIRSLFISWVTPTFKNKPTSEALSWYKTNCLK